MAAGDESTICEICKRGRVTKRIFQERTRRSSLVKKVPLTACSCFIAGPISWPVAASHSRSSFPPQERMRRSSLVKRVPLGVERHQVESRAASINSMLKLNQSPACTIRYLISRTVSEDDAHRGNQIGHWSLQEAYIRLASTRHHWQEDKVTEQTLWKV